MKSKSSVEHNDVNFLTFDVEEWYAVNYKSVNLSLYNDSGTHLEKNMDKLLEICAENKIKSTCFIVGDIARNKPNIIKKIHSEGHEVASHSYNHKMINTMTPDQFRLDLHKSCDILEQIIGEQIIGYRAPSWSVNQEILPWFYNILNERGIKYSSSVFPGKTFLYGIKNFPQEIHQPLIDGVKQPVWEIPQVLFSVIGKKYGFSGGFYLRALPLFFVKKLIVKKNRKRKNIFVYLHPREIDPKSPKLKLPLIEKLIHYYGVKGCEFKLRSILKNFQPTFTRMGDYINQLNQSEK
ncbi:MAG: polysaccharide deacetylase family protein [Bacteroidales bacterium]|nr:polysaccharide deacetylase family protein [Bacteroidales bacterium]